MFKKALTYRYLILTRMLRHINKYELLMKRERTEAHMKAHWPALLKMY